MGIKGDSHIMTLRCFGSIKRYLQEIHSWHVQRMYGVFIRRINKSKANRKYMSCKMRFKLSSKASSSFSFVIISRSNNSLNYWCQKSKKEEELDKSAKS